MSEATQTHETVDVSDVLLDPAVQASLNTILEKLPQIAQVMTALTKDEETLTSLTTVIENLPRLSKIVYLLGRVYQAAEDVVTDGDTLEGFSNMFQNFTKPAVDVAKKGLRAYNAAKERAEHDTTVYSVFSLLKLLKDPNVQKGIRLVTAMLDELGKESHQE
ncbi:hypothetical protein Alches_14600 [Alicyclobacillus hesperidum subsp. aegles]|uniref:Uncharacterized conserved protein YjgD, DUF1641 family n=1 Tax=Alicyclobacillus hesperidum TaxID=89784 RepID=A0A1H2QEN8_9BACL|nr:DUF1641 domain-containing protein [Alicyclobacillus hesperidum]KRW92915.1 hypothetical protein SD51_01190 [Alicyclobacillus tengchongensis]GLG01421.1 hypothetical protein Alches_14600 [Alicyclobacillus hesperidum subsp. aegles]GLV12667.1 hypothetical protein Heshes_03510 [Alicyclobacillus hesperidum]SDW05733.1 Uncharacterized conserved protein YjgD, DUF1641 family [Alicyclobacillus hesperidum]